MFMQMKIREKVSVIVPIYKVKNEIERCLESVFEQENIHLELILVNDCTPDSSFLVAQEIIKKAPSGISIKIIEHDINQGLSAARNSGMKVATGDYIFFLDSDDNLTTPNALSLLLKIAYDNDYPDLVIGNYQYIVDGKVANQPKLIEQYYESNEALFIAYATKGIYWSAWGRLVKRDFINENNFSFRVGLYSEDILWTFQLFRKAKRVYITPEIVYDYYNRPGSIMYDIKRKHVDDLVIIVELIYQAYQKELDYLPRATSSIIERYRRMALKYIFALENSDREYRLSVIRRLKELNVKLSLSSLRYFRQNILLRAPTGYIERYLKLKWKNRAREH